jgi:hypothetical protein
MKGWDGIRGNNRDGQSILAFVTNVGYFHNKCLSRTRNWILDLMVRRIRCCLALLLIVVTEAATEGFLLRLFCVKLLGDGKLELFVK